GKRPFSGSNPEIMRAVLNDRPANPSDVNPHISAQLDWAVQKSLAKNKPERFQTARDFSEAFLKGIEASIRNTLGEPEPASLSEVTTQRIDANLIQAARLLSGMEFKAPTPSAPGPGVPPPAAAAEPAAPTPEPAPETKKPRIVFVDDEERILNALKS